MEKTIKVMIAGIGGASLGTEIFKSLKLAGGYDIYGCDISLTAYGLYEKGFKHTYCINQENYVNEVIEACQKSGATYLISGGEQPMVILGEASKTLAENDITLVSNSSEIVGLFSDKFLTFEKLKKSNIPIPRTIVIHSKEDVESIGLPCIVKPATGSGGSTAVFFAVSVDEVMIYAEFIRRNHSQPLAQEYIGIDEGEFTIGVLSLPDQSVFGSIALRRELSAKLSVSYNGRGGVISSGYSQGYIDEYPDLCMQAENIAKKIGSHGPINIQARVREGVLLPFEINPRFSASTYLRALAGFNEIDIFLRYLNSEELSQKPKIQTGWYLRSLAEKYVSEESIK